MTDSNGSGLTSPQEILGRKERRFITVEHDGVTVRLRSLTAREMRRIRDSVYDNATRENRLGWIILCHTMVDDAGKPVMSEENLSDLEQIDGSLSDALCNAALRHVGWNNVALLKQYEDAKKNSEKIPGDASSLESQPS